MYEQHLHIDNTLEEVSRAIRTAENTFREHIRTYYHDANEEFITTAFYGHIKYTLAEASKSRRIEEAFIKDLQQSIQYVFGSEWQIHQEARGLIADIVLHNKHEEARTGGDFGLIIIHPKIRQMTNGLLI